VLSRKHGIKTWITAHRKLANEPDLARLLDKLEEAMKTPFEQERSEQSG
jgi:hypothetical protein